jgi:phosphoglycolate phosphatase-like HAD superfamily hydrolase
MTKSSLLLFDIDGTILTSGGAGETALRHGFYDAFGLEENLTQIDISGRTDSAIARQVLAKHGIEASSENLERFFNGYLRNLESQLPLKTGRLLPGILPLLQTLSDIPSVCLGLLTGNLKRGATLKLQHYGVHHLFELGAFADDHHDRNQLGPFALERAVKMHGVAFPPQNVFVIGDTPHDIACARAIGASAVAVATGSFSTTQLADCNPDSLFADLSDSPAVLQALGQTV